MLAVVMHSKHNYFIDCYLKNNGERKVLQAIAPVQVLIKQKRKMKRVLLDFLQMLLKFLQKPEPQVCLNIVVKIVSLLNISNCFFLYNKVIAHLPFLLLMIFFASSQL